MSKENREVLVHVDHMKKYFPVRKKESSKLWTTSPLISIKGRP